MEYKIRHGRKERGKWITEKWQGEFESDEQAAMAGLKLLRDTIADQRVTIERRFYGWGYYVVKMEIKACEQMPCSKEVTD